MHLNDYLRLIAGVMILSSLALGAVVHPNWNYLALFVALNLIQPGFRSWVQMR